ncbi:integrase, catalytic region, zinc finger, CCHC-type containing protein [Tanacetum coccineum]|uniref:Integrase, catalytic region, zinc finger, CCHC-type containing protein n=1 Tax=Tanacetum coccineum TaxID=301880 RepID=A0ABQ5CKH6_9ASTR
MCVVNILNSVNATPTVKIVLNKGKQIWKPKGKLSDNSLNKTKQVWKATGKLFANVGLSMENHMKESRFSENLLRLSNGDPQKEICLRRTVPFTKLMSMSYIGHPLVYGLRLFKHMTGIFQAQDCRKVHTGQSDSGMITSELSWVMENMFIMTVFTWVKFLRSKDETPEFVINFLKQIQVGLNKTVRYIRTDNGTEFVNQVMSTTMQGVGHISSKVLFQELLNKTALSKDEIDNAMSLTAYADRINADVKRLEKNAQDEAINTNDERISLADDLKKAHEQIKTNQKQVKVLNEGQNVDFKNKENFQIHVATVCRMMASLKQTLSEHLKEKESLMQKVSLLKDDFKKEESRNIDREIALEKRIKQLDNIVFKRDQSAQTVHMLTKPQFFYDHTTKQALGFQNPFYLKKAQQLEPKLYVGDIIEKTNPIVIPDSEETLTLAEESRSKMLLKHKDNMMLEKQVNTTIDVMPLVPTYKDIETRFSSTNRKTAQTSPCWSKNSCNSLKPTLSSRPTKVEVPKVLPKVSMVNTSLKKLKHHLAGFECGSQRKNHAHSYH